jgi:Ser/Thr protein kinase RdoA (MazF antagonist)
MMLGTMMSVTAIHRLVQTVDDQRRSPISDAVAAAWAYPPGAARHWRSSASHVFMVERTPVGRAYLRFVPAAHRQRDELLRVAQVMHDLGVRGVAVALPVPSRSDALVETVPTELGDMHAMVVREASGEQLEVAALTADRTMAWGTALARLHCYDGDAGRRLPEPFGELPNVAEALPEDPELIAAAARITRRLDDLPRDRARFGFVHGDFELDNLCWNGSHAVAYDFDEAARSWFVADIAAAVRDLGAAALDAFVAGYRQVSPLPDGDLALLPLFSAAHAACSVVRVRSALDASQPDEPPWLRQLRQKLVSYVDRQRLAAIAVGRTMGARSRRSG